jgi:hypothetical protein
MMKIQVATLKNSLLKAKAEQSASIVFAGNILELDAELFRLFLSEKGMAGIVLCVDRPWKYYESLLQEHGIDTSRVYYLDATGKGEPDDQVAYTDDIGNMTFLRVELLKLVDRASSEQPKARLFVLFDSIQSLELYNSREQLAKFFHGLSLQLRQRDAYAVYVLDPNNPINPVLQKLCDVGVSLVERPEERFAKALGWAGA